MLVSRHSLHWLHSFLLLLATSPAAADDELFGWRTEAESQGPVYARSAELATRMHSEFDRTHRFFDEAYGYAIFPTITRVGFGFGGAYGKGIVVVNDEIVARTSYKQFTSGIQAGAKGFGMVIFFRDEAAFQTFEAEQTQFAGQAGIDVLTVGANGTPSCNEGVAIAVMPKLGLMAEFTISGVWFRYWPIDESA